MAERTDYEYGPITPVPEDQQEYFFDPELRGQLERGEAFQGVPLSVSQDRRMAENPIGTIATGIGSLLDRDRREVFMPASQEFGPTSQEFNPANNQFENRTTETIRPGVYGTPETMPGLSGTPIYQGLDAASSLISDTAARRRGLEDSAQARSQAAEMIPQIPQMLVDQADVSMEAGLRGERVVNEQNMSGTPFEMISAPIGALGAGRVAMDIPEGRSFGIFGSGKGASGQQAEDTVSMLEDAGLNPAEGWERQSGANTFKAYRSSLDNKVRYEIPMQNLSFTPAVRVTEDPDVELGKALDPETRTEERLLNMQRMRIEEFGGEERLIFPKDFNLNEAELNKYGFTKIDGKVGKNGLQLFPKLTLEQLINFPELFEEYPQLRGIKIASTPSFSLFTQGSYSPDEKMIRLNSQPNTPEGREQLMSVVMHEVQHAVQDIEGLYGGANTDMFKPTGFGDREKASRQARKQLDKEINDDLYNIVVSKDKKTGIFSTAFNLGKDVLLSRKGDTAYSKQLGNVLSANDALLVKSDTRIYLKTRAEEENEIAKGRVPEVVAARKTLDLKIKAAQDNARVRGETEQKIQQIETAMRSDPSQYKGSDRLLIFLNDSLKESGVNNPESVTESIQKTFDERVPQIQKVIAEEEAITGIEEQMFSMYQGNPGEVEARNVQRRFEGLKTFDNNRVGTPIRNEEGQIVFPSRAMSGEELQRTFPEDTQKMVLPEEGVFYSLMEGRGPSLSIDNSGINNDLDKKRAKLQQQQGIYANRNGQLLGDGSSSKPLAATTRKKLEEERRVAGRKAMELSHEIDIEEAEPNLPDNIITRDSSGSILPSTDYHQANQLAFHGTRGADSRIMEEGGVHMKTDEPAFFMVDSPAASMTYGAGGIGDLGTVVPMRIDTRGFAEIDYRGRSYGELDEGGTVGVEFPQETTFLGQKGTAFEVEIDFDDIVTVRVDGSAAKTVPVDLIEQYHPEGRGVVNEETFLNAVKDAGAPGARLNEINDLHPTGAMVLRGSTQLKLPETQEILTVFDKSRQRLAKGNPASRDDDLMTGIVRNPLSGFGQGGPVQNFNQGGMVSPMNKPRITQGLTNLLNKYSTGPLAGAGNVPRGTPVQSFAPGGPVANYNPRLDPSLDFSDPLNPPEGYEYLGLGGESGQVLTGADDFIYVGDPVADAPLDLVTTTPPVTANTSPVSTTPAYTDAPVAETVNFVDNPVTSVPVVTPASTTPATTEPLISDLAVSTTPATTTPATTTPATTTPVAVSEPIPNPVTYPTAAVDPVVAPIDDTPLPPSVYTPPLPPVESVYTPPAATVVDTPETLFTPPPPVFEVPEAKPYNYLQDLRPNFDISDVIKTQTSGYTPTQGMVINPTQYQYPGAPEITGEDVYVPEIYQSLPSLELSTVDVEDLADTTGTTDTAGETDTEDTADTTQGTSFASLDSLSSNQQAYNREQDYADRYGYTLEELRQINAERLRMGLPRLQDLHRDIGGINFSGGM